MDIPDEIKEILGTLQGSGFESYIVGGCVRDFLLNQTPKDWDITTNAKPDEIAALFPKSFYENDFGTVSVITESEDPALKTIEITPFRVEGKYTDKRHPDAIQFAKTLADDLARRDFTVNAIAMNINSKFQNPNVKSNPKSKIPAYAKASAGKQNLKQKNKTSDGGYHIIDLFEGQKDLENKIIRAVGDPAERFGEDALRLLRAVRFATTLGQSAMWDIEESTKTAIENNGQLLKFISQERIRDELVKIITHPNGARGLEMARRLGLLTHIMPELKEGFNVAQNKHHVFQIYEHNLLSLNYACQKNFGLQVRLAALLHDIAKPRTKKGEGLSSTFYNHEVLGAKMASQILRRLKFAKKDIEKVVTLVRFHLFYYNVDEVGESSVRRLLRNVGPENIEELLQVRYADRMGSGVAKAEPYKLRHLKYLFERVSQDPISPKAIKVNGNDIMQVLNISPCPKVGHILSYLLSVVLSTPSKNEREFLTQEVIRLGQLPENELANLAQNAKKDIERVENKRDEMTKKKYWVS